MKQKELSTSTIEDIDARERAYWNALANGDSQELKLELSTTDPLVSCQLALLGSLDGKEVLELGAGTGEWAIRLALHGANVTAIDVADEAVALTNRRAEANGVADRVRAVTMSAYEMDFPAASFDLIHGTSVLHHLKCELVGPELKRVLKPGGKAVFMENSANNPLLMLARKLCGRFGIPRWSSDDEYPLRKSDINAVAVYFPMVKAHYPQFLFFFWLDAKIFKYRVKPINRLFGAFDAFIYRYLPFLRRYSYLQVLEFKD